MAYEYVEERRGGAWHTSMSRVISKEWSGVERKGEERRGEERRGGDLDDHHRGICNKCAISDELQLVCDK